MFLNGFLLASLFYFHTESSYEDALFGSIKRDIDSRLTDLDTQDSIVVKAMRTCNYLMINRAPIFMNGNLSGFKADVIHPASVDLMTTRGACGSYAEVLARVLQNYNFPIRIAQMKAHGIFADHNIVEVKTDKGWVVLDATFNAYFIRPDHRLASFDDVKNDWPYYSKQVPPGYDLSYKYEDVRYSNWTKIPVVFPAIKKVLTLFIGQENIKTFCIRIFFLRMYELYFYITLLIYIPVFIFITRRFIRTKIIPDNNTPLTFRNIIKYAKPPLGRVQSS